MAGETLEMISIRRSRADPSEGSHSRWAGSVSVLLGNCVVSCLQ